jgi:hypothetical protein
MKSFALLIRYLAPCAAFLATLPVHASEAQLAPLFVEPSEKPDSGKAASLANSVVTRICRIAVVELRDETWPRDYVGSYFEEVIRPPTDRLAWMRSLVSGLERRGVTVLFPLQGELVPSDARAVSISLKLAWMDFYNADLNATIGLHLASVDRARPFEVYARGDGQRSMTMGSVGGRGTEAINRAGAAALDKLVMRMGDWCKAS